MVAEEFTLAAAQIEPVYHDKEATVDKACDWIEKAGKQGVDLVVFPEAFVPGYPYWQGTGPLSRWTEIMVDLQKNSLHVEDDEMEVLSEVIDEANVHVSLGANELSDQGGSETVYNSIFFFDRDGELVRRHRKLQPTFYERAVWGRGDPSSLTTHDTDIGNVGGLICYENHMTNSKAALQSQGMEIHTALWAGFWEQHGHTGSKSRATSEDATQTCDIYPAMREIAYETQSFVVSCGAYMDDLNPEGFNEGELDFDLGAGGSMIINPSGIVKAGPAIDDEVLLTADFKRDERRATKAIFDSMGHYSRWDSVNLNVSDTTLKPFERTSTSAHNGVESDRNSEPEMGFSPASIEKIANEHNLSIDVVDRVAEDLKKNSIIGDTEGQ